MNQVPRIHELPQPYRRLLRSSLALHSFDQVVIELVNNAVDAGATTVRVDVDPDALKLVVADNGCGIHPDDVPAVGRLHYSSKCDGDVMTESSPRFHGFRGQALSALSELAHVQLASKAAHSTRRVHWLLNATTGPRILSCKDHDRGPSGTTITAADVFYNVPVRRRLWRPDELLAKTRLALERIAVAHPHLAVTLVDSRSRQTVLATSPCGSSLAALRQLCGPTAVPLISHAFRVLGSTATEPSVHGEWFESPHPQSLVFVNQQACGAGEIHSLFTRYIQGVLGAKSFGFICHVECSRHVALSHDLIKTLLKRQLEHPAPPPTSSGRPPASAPAPAPAVPDWVSPNARIARPEPAAPPTPARPPVVRRTEPSLRGIVIDPRTGFSKRTTPLRRVSTGRITRPSTAPGPPPTAACALLAIPSPPPTPATAAGCRHNHDPAAAVVSTTAETPLTRGDLARLRVLGQVDCKFILGVSPPARAGGTLSVVAIDQHAADERVRLEELLAECARGLPVVPLSAPAAFVLPRNIGVDDAARDRLLYWGIFIDPDPDPDGDAAWILRGLPSLLLRAKLTSADAAQLVAGVLGDAHGRPPAPVLHAVQSRACRSAIMFGDALPAAACATLVRAVSATRCPFQCAHGRPSMVPLLTTATTAAR
ncbi:DNA mismatch repair protein [Blastocladiella emersonii ATCC 22665]|nr:DNA mismatch repair protein [Blastocladiella emersonii ATCC 22665]